MVGGAGANALGCAQMSNGCVGRRKSRRSTCFVVAAAIELWMSVSGDICTEVRRSLSGM